MNRKKTRRLTGDNDLSWDVSQFPSLNENEIKILLSLIYSFHNNTEYNISERLNANLLWEYILRHGLGGLVGYLSMKNLIDHEYLSEKGWECYLQNIYMHKQCLDACSMINNAANKIGVPIGFMKGPAIVQQAYGDPGIRSYSDIDIFVKSRNDAILLTEALGASPMMKSRTSIHRFSDAVKIDAIFKDWMIEFSYPLENSSDPQYDLLNKHISKIVVQSDQLADVCNPDPDIHFIFLILHMGINHFFSRFIWLLDIAQLYRSKIESLDFEYMHNELNKLNLTSLANASTAFCKKYIDNDIPLFEGQKRNSSVRFIKKLTDPHIIAGRHYSLKNRGSMVNVYPYLMIIVKFFIFTGSSGLHFRSNASRWTTWRFLNSFGLLSKKLSVIVEPLISLIFIPLSKILSLFSLRVMQNISRR